MFNFATSSLSHRPAVVTALAVLASMGSLAPPAHGAGSCEATTHEAALELVRDTTNNLFTAMEARQGVLSEDPALARQLVEEFITPHVDLQGFSKLVLGKNWRKATAEQRQRFLTQFHALILRTYATAVTTYTGIQVQYLPMRGESRKNFATVRSIIPRPGGEGAKVNYRLHCRNNVWKLFDVSIAGVSMVTTYRSAFSAEVRRSGLDGLIEVLEQKNREVGA